MNEIIEIGMKIKVWLNGRNDTLKFTGDVLGINTRFIEILDNIDGKRKVLCISNMTNIEILKEVREQDEGVEIKRCDG